MKKLLITLCVLILSTQTYAECVIPQPFSGNTGNNMTVMLTGSFLSTLNLENEDAYIVASTPDGLIVGSEPVFGLTQTTLAVWGDDSSTTGVDGAVSGVSITLQLVDGTNLYALTAPSPIMYSAGGMSVQSSDGSPDLCKTDVQDGNCDYPGIFDGNTGNNMTLMLTTAFFDDLTVVDESAYIAASSGGILVGSIDVFGISQTALAIWGDDTSTSDVDGAVTGSNITLELVDGNTIYSISTEQIPYAPDGTHVVTSLTSVVRTCGVTEVQGCTSEWADNYDISANVDDGSCTLTGCMESAANNYNAQANDAGACEYLGCTNSNACNFDAQANNDDGSCYFNQTGYDCNDVCLIDTDSDGVCDGFEVLGCMEPQACNYDENATDAGYCSYPSQSWLNCEEECIADADNDGICDEFEVSGCIDPTAFNYNGNATDDDGSCVDVVLGCTNASATNHNASANTDNGSCLIEGCTDNSAFNFNSEANINDGSCQAIVVGCTDNTAANYNAAANVDDDSCEVIVLGCTDASALNYNGSANVDDSSCEYVSFNGAWPSDPGGLNITGNNATIAVTGDLSLDNGDYVGAFYQSDGALVCGGLLVWDTDATNQLIVVWGDDVSTDTKDGFAAGDHILWMAYDASSGENINLYPTYSRGDNAYMVNATYVISDWLVDPTFGCTNLAYQEYHSAVLVDDGSCSTLWSDLHVNTDSLLVDANYQIDTLTTSLLNLNNKYNTTVIIMQADYDSVVLDYQGQLFDLNTSLTDSLNYVHAEWDLAVSNLVADSLALEAEVAGLETHVSELQADSTQFEADIASLQADSLALELEVAGLESHVANLQSDSTAFEAHVAALQSDSTQFEADVDELENYVSELKSDSTDLEATIAQKLDQIANLISAHNAEILALNTAHDAAAAGLNADALAAADAASDLLQQTIENYKLDSANTVFNYETQISTLTSGFQNDIAILVADSTALELEISGLENDVLSLQADSTQFEADIASLQSDSLALEVVIAGLEADKADLTENLNYHSAPLYVDLAKGWNMIGFPLQESMNAAASLEIMGANLHLIKNNAAKVYWPEFGFNSLGTLDPGQGYQVRMYEAHDDYTFPYIPGQRLEVSPQVPAWVEDLVIPEHPNDIRSLVSIVNMLGQQVDPNEVFKGDVLLYLYSDGSVEKIVK
jgi:peptidoglycan hydrolase CwlO-like protein